VLSVNTPARQHARTQDYNMSKVRKAFSHNVYPLRNTPLRFVCESLGAKLAAWNWAGEPPSDYTAGACN
jgi:hypothetical protein